MIPDSLKLPRFLLQLLPYFLVNLIRAGDVPALARLRAQGLRIAQETGIEVVILRPPLVYGPGVKANFQSMMRWLYSGIPLPFGSINNLRSMVSLGNLVDFIATCLLHPEAKNQIFLVSDGEDISTTQLLRRLSAKLGKPARSSCDSANTSANRSAICLEGRRILASIF